MSVSIDIPKEALHALVSNGWSYSLSTTDGLSTLDVWHPSGRTLNLSDLHHIFTPLQANTPDTTAIHFHHLSSTSLSLLFIDELNPLKTEYGTPYAQWLAMFTCKD